jgi:hypothetical protein
MPRLGLILHWPGQKTGPHWRRHIRARDGRSTSPVVTANSVLSVQFRSYRRQYWGLDRRQRAAAASVSVGFSTARPRWRDCCAVLTLTPCSMNTSLAMALPCSSMLVGLVPRASCPRRSTAAIARVHARFGSRFAIPRVSRCSGSAARSGTDDPCAQGCRRNDRWLRRAPEITRRSQIRLIAQAVSRGGKATRGFVVGRLLDVFDEGNRTCSTVQGTGLAQRGHDDALPNGFAAH